MDHQRHMLELIEYTKAHSRFVPYASSLVDSNGNTLMVTLADESGCPVLHAEVNVIQKAHQKYQDLKWNELTLYSTGEPCAMCAAATCWSHIKTVVYGSDIPLMQTLWGDGIEGSLRTRDVIKTFPRPPQLIESVCKEQCDQMFYAFQQPFYDFWNSKRWSLC